MNQLKNMILEGKFPLVMSLPKNDPELARVAWENGADAVKIHINVHHQASGTHFYSFDEEKDNIMQMLKEAKGPMGIVAGGDPVSAENDFEKIIEAGFDFISLYSFNYPTSILLDNRITKMMAPGSGFSESEYQEIENIGADILEASIFDDEGSDLTMNGKKYIAYRRVCANTSLPVLLPTQHKILPSEVVMLKKCGIGALMIGAVVTGKEKDGIAKAVKEYRQAIDEMKGC